MISTLRTDWRASRDPLSRISLTIFRYGQWAQRSRLSSVALWGYRAANLVLARGFAGCDIPRQSQIGPGLILHHGGRGVAIHKEAVLGAGCELYQGVAIGNRDDSGAPVIGDRVRLGAYAVILGRVKVGDGARIGPHAVVLTDVPPGALVPSPISRIVAR